MVEDYTQMAMYENDELDAIGGGFGWALPLEDMDRIKADPELSKELQITPRLSICSCSTRSNPGSRFRAVMIRQRFP